MVSANKPIQRPIPLANITPFLNKTATLFYTVDDGSPVLRTSPELDVRVERQSSELLPPRVPSLNNGVLDPRTVPDAGVVVIVTYVTGMLQGDTVRLHWDNTIAAGTDQSDRIVGSQPTDIQFSVPRDKIYAGINGTVDVWYEWLRGGVRQGASTGLDFTIKLPALPPATIDQAVGTVLNPDDVPATGATVRIDSSAAFQQGDQIELRWTGLPGAGSGTFLYNAQDSDVGKDVTITVDKSIVVADTGQTVTLDYTLMRAAGGQDEISPPSVYDVRREIGSGDVLVMGARAGGGSHQGILSRPQYLRALDKNTRGDLVAEWRYDDESTWIQDTTFHDTRPWVALKVRTKSGQVTINPVNIIGSGMTLILGGSAPIAAFTALLSGDSVISWGAPDYGGNVPPTIMTYTNVVEVDATGAAFAARLSNGRAVPWGNTAMGGSMPPTTNIVNAKRIFGNGGAFVAIEGNGTLAAWGPAGRGGTLSAEAAALSDVVTIATTDCAFCALRRNNQVMAWGPSTCGGEVPGNIRGLNDIVDVRGNLSAFCALRSNGTVVAWGDPSSGGSVPDAIAARRDIAKLASATGSAFAVLTTGGDVLAWGASAYGGTVPTDIGAFDDIVDVSATYKSFCARRSNGKVVSWGAVGTPPKEILDLDDIVQVASTSLAFAALRRNGTVVAWPASTPSGDTAAVASQLVNIRAVYGNAQAFAALKEGGGVATWGNSVAGGDSSGVKSVLDSSLFYQATSGGVSYATEQGKAIAALDV
ncbi:hypothetical protein PHO31112_01343 [Pandoraea horticolens]|uniref:Uncharacterized protein n=2 Tax=Pandoraea horticolens TaxID=2508298 RepID=A0A5E4TD76_9BURK|nr:hypothetical protein PHO31112_01343 [Pandoraea horticolens]